MQRQAQKPRGHQTAGAQGAPAQTLSAHSGHLGQRHDGLQRERWWRAAWSLDTATAAGLGRRDDGVVQVHVNTSVPDAASAPAADPAVGSPAAAAGARLVSEPYHRLRAPISGRVAEPKKNKMSRGSRAPCCKGSCFTGNVTAILCSHSLSGEMRKDAVADRRR